MTYNPSVSESLRNELEAIVARYGVETILTGVLDPTITDPVRKAAGDIMEVFEEFWDSAADSQDIMQIAVLSARCIFNDTLHDIADPYRGRYHKAFPFLATLSLMTDIDVAPAVVHLELPELVDRLRNRLTQ